MKKLVLVFLFLLLSAKVYATAQMPDYLIYKGKSLPIFSNPLESYFDEENLRPFHIFIYSCTALWRGYFATWEIKENYLYLIKLVEGTCEKDAGEIPVSLIFPDQTLPVKATWFTGRLIIPQGKELRYEHMGYESVYEKELWLTIKKESWLKKNFFIIQ